DLVSLQDQRLGYRQPEGLGGLKVDDELELGWPLDWQIGWLGSPEDSVFGGASVKILGTGSVGHEPAGPRIEAEHIHSGQSMPGGGINDQRPIADKKVVLLHDEGADMSCSDACKRSFELGRRAHVG